MNRTFQPFLHRSDDSDGFNSVNRI